ncbi:MAG: hypothetical protein RRB13_11430 [bacterium]|nr:hypothetical protein [bacterium]
MEAKQISIVHVLAPGAALLKVVEELKGLGNEVRLVQVQGPLPPGVEMAHCEDIFSIFPDLLWADHTVFFIEKGAPKPNPLLDWLLSCAFSEKEIRCLNYWERAS